MNKQNIVVFDFETGSVDTRTCEVIEIACAAYDPRKLEIIPGSEFVSLVRPLDFNNIQDEALRVNHKTKEELCVAPELSVVWPRFCDHIHKYNANGKSPFTAPIPAGYNTRNFDMPIFNRICQKFGYCSKNGVQNVFHTMNHFDLRDIVIMFFENSEALPNYKFDTLRPYFGLEGGDNAHTAMFDVIQTGELLTRYLKLIRTLNIRFKDSCRKAVA